MKLSDDHLQTFDAQGFVVVEDFYPEEQRAAIATAIRQTLPPWEALKDDPPEGSRLADDFPYDDMFFNELIVDWDLIEFVQRVLDTEEIGRFSRGQMDKTVPLESLLERLVM